MEHSTTLFERDCLTAGKFLILETSTGDETTEKLIGIVIAAKFSPEGELLKIFSKEQYSIDLKRKDSELLVSDSELLYNRMKFFENTTESYLLDMKYHIYDTYLKKYNTDIKNSKVKGNEEYQIRMEKAFGKDKSNWIPLTLDKNTYVKYKEFFDKINNFITDFKELRELINTF